MEKPKAPLLRILYEDDCCHWLRHDKRCTQCGSSLKKNYILLIIPRMHKSKGCIQPKCSNYYKNK